MKAIIISAIISLLKRVTVRGLVSLVQHAVKAAEDDKSRIGRGKFNYVVRIIRDQPEYKTVTDQTLNWVIETAVAWLKSRA